MTQAVPNSTIEDAVFDWVQPASGLAADHVRWADQDMPRVAAPYIVLRLVAMEPTGRDWRKSAPNPLVFADKTITLVVPGTDTLTIAGHGLATGDGPVHVTNPPPGLAALTDYWVFAPDADHLRLCLSLYKANRDQHVDITGAGSGTIKIVSTANTVQRGAEVTNYARGLRRCRLTIQCFGSSATGSSDAVGILNDVIAKASLPAYTQALRAAKIGVPSFGGVQNVGAALNSAHFEPRAVVECVFFAPSEVSATGAIVEYVEITQSLAAPDGVDLGDVTRWVPSDPSA